ncbi:MAG: thioredoxin domain-containing protein [Cyanobacteriota bacterium]|nr:thioredoxin domain-containing protein [Cyanobacteriota bacterium]
MASAPDPSPAAQGNRERIILAVITVVLAALLLWLRGGLHPQAPLERLARQSLELPVALTNGRPTLVEFYADWCEACRTMAPAMEQLEQRQREHLDVVLLNVDNPRWQPELERFEVNGIPQIELFGSSGESVGRAIGALGAPALQAIGEALVAGEPLPRLAGLGGTVGATSSLAAATPATMAAPRSHG